MLKAQIFLEGGCMYIKKGKRSEKKVKNKTKKQ